MQSDKKEKFSSQAKVQVEFSPQKSNLLRKKSRI